MLTEILIKPFIEDLERQGIEDTTPYEQGFMAGMYALSSILSEHFDNKAQLFVYLGMSVSEGMQWVKSQVSESPEKPHPIEFVVPRHHTGSEIDNLTPRERHPTPSSDLEPDPQVEWDWIPLHDDLPASLIQKYAKKDVFFRFFPEDSKNKGKAILDLSSNRLQVIDMSGDQVKRPYYIKLR
jgi:hypothetical protein